MRFNRFGVAGWCCLVLAVACLARGARAGDQPIVTSDLLRLRAITSIDVANDGSKAVFALRSIAQVEEDEGPTIDRDGKPRPPKYEYRSHLYVIDLTIADTSAVQLTHGRRNDHSPRLAPDGRSVAFVRAGTEEGRGDKPQVWLMPLGGSGGEARAVTDFKHGAANPVWSPLGTGLVVSSSLPMEEIEGVPPYPMERPRRTWKDAESKPEQPIEPRPDGTREQIRAWLEQNAQRDNPTVITRLDFHDELNLKPPMRFAHLFLVPAQPAEPTGQSAAVQLTRGFFDHTDACFLPAGEKVVYAAKKPTDRHPDRVLETALWMVNVDGTGDRVVLSRQGWSFDSPRPSMDGSIIAFRAEQTDEPNYRQTLLGMTPTAGDGTAEPIWLTDTLDRSVGSFEWMTSRGAILFTCADRGAFPLYSISPSVLQPTPIVEGARGVHAFDVGGGAIVYALTTPADPCALVVSTPRHGERIAFRPNTWVYDKALSVMQEGWIDRPDGTRVQYWIMPPTNMKEGEKYPLVLNIHGGPSAMWGPGEMTMWHEFQLMCSWGYGVVFCNPRGSGGYGYAFQKANHQNWGTGPGGDVLAAVDRALNLPWVDADRLVVTGGSYAGYLTAWLIAHDQRFKAAVAQRGVYDLTTFFGEGNAWRLVPWAMGGYPWESTIRPILSRESPFTHVLRIRTPLLITHASSDLRTGVSQSEMLYRALKVLERPVEYVRYPNAGHDLSRTGDPLQRMDRLNRIIEFFERHVQNPRAAPVVPSGG